VARKSARIGERQENVAGEGEVIAG